ncbi:unnamed protein product [Mytilus edulis]|uniref:Uncharacterized protein n=1 Tax=Mytilus edulis TaxID=6550 RepID=A0A8S3S348_MYTED|nr:unnamed protein product [Mytilus edulis]
MEPPNEKISFEKLNVGAFGNSSYNQAYSSPPECCGKQSDLNGYIQPINENGNRISSNHDYLIVQGSIKSNLSSNKELRKQEKGNLIDLGPYSVIADNKKEDHCGNNKEFSDLEIQQKKGDHCGNNKEFSDLDNCPYSVIADSNIKQQEVKLNFPQIKYVSDIMAKIMAIDENASSFLPSISNKTNSSTTISVTFETTIRSTEPSTYTTTNSAALLTTPTHSQEISSGTVKNLDIQLENVYQ